MPGIKAFASPRGVTGRRVRLRLIYFLGGRLRFSYVWTHTGSTEISLVVTTRLDKSP